MLNYASADFDRYGNDPRYAEPVSDDQLITHFSDDELYEMFNARGVNRLVIHKLRKGDTGPSGYMIGEMRRIVEERCEIYRDCHPCPPGDPNNPDFSHPEFAKYDKMLRDRVEEVGWQVALAEWSQVIACGCSGQKEAPFCNCAMVHLTASRYGTVKWEFYDDVPPLV